MRVRVRGRLVTDLERSYPSAAACLAEDLPALCVHLEYRLRLRRRPRSAGTTATDDRGAALRRLERHAEILGLAKEQEEADKYRRRAAILRASIERRSGA